MRAALIAALVFDMVVAIGVCALVLSHEHAKAVSWDQENLKRGDHGCPTAVFVAPRGELVQCP